MCIKRRSASGVQGSQPKIDTDAQELTFLDWTFKSFSFGIGSKLWNSCRIVLWQHGSRHKGHDFDLQDIMKFKFRLVFQLQLVSPCYPIIDVLLVEHVSTCGGGDRIVGEETINTNCIIWQGSAPKLVSWQGLWGAELPALLVELRCLRLFRLLGCWCWSGEI